MSDTHTVPRTRSRSRRFREIALSIGAVAGLICVLFALAAVFFGITPLIFRSGSMAPAIDTGALALSKSTPAAEIAVGDVVKVTNASGKGITHRVVQIGAVGTDSVQLFLQGDANAEPDAESYVVSEADRVFFSVGKLGYAVTWLSGPVAVFLGGIAVGALLMTAFGFRRSTVDSPAQSDEEDRSQEPRGGRHSAQGRGTSNLSVMLALAAISAVGISASHTPTTLAAGQDTATALSGTVTTGLVPPPGALSCTSKNREILFIGLMPYVTLTWATAGAGFTYRLTLSRSGQSDIVIPVSTTAASGNISRDVENGAILNLAPLNGQYTARVQTVSGTRLSNPSAGFTIDFSSLLVLLPSAICGSSVPLAPQSAGTNARSAQRAAVPETTTPAPTESSLVPAPTAESTTSSPTTTSPGELEPSTTTPNTTTPNTTSPNTTTPTTTATPTTTTDTPAAAPAAAPPPEETTTTPPAPAVLSGPVTSTSGASTARVVSLDGAPTLQIVDTAGTVQYSAPATSSDAYGYGVNWSGDQLWILGPNQHVRLDGSGGSWSRTLVDPTATDQIPADILALLN